MKTLLGSFVAVCAGWLAGVLCVEVFSLAQALLGRVPPDVRTFLLGPLAIGLLLWAFILPVWLLVLIPLYVLVPTTSLLWRAPLCTACGSGAGLLIVAALLFGSGWPVDALGWLAYASGAVVGGVSCLTGSLTRARFQHRTPVA